MRERRPRDLYSILGVRRGAPSEDIHAAFSAAFPAVNADGRKVGHAATGTAGAADSTAEAEQQLQLAHRVLSDDRPRGRRALYDVGGMDLVRLAEQQLGQGSRFASQVLPGPPLRLTQRVRLADAYRGVTTSVWVKRRVISRACRHSNRGQCAQLEHCPDEEHVSRHPSGIVQRRTVRSANKCEQASVSLPLVVLPGMPEGTEHAFPFLAAQQAGQIPGDVIVELRTSSQPSWSRQAQHLHHTVTLPLKQALLGFKRQWVCFFRTSFPSAPLAPHDFGVRSASGPQTGSNVC